MRRVVRGPRVFAFRLMGLDGCEVRLCDPCARVRPCAPCVSFVRPGSPRCLFTVPVESAAVSAVALTCGLCVVHGLLVSLDGC